ncbi:MAG: GyrI-like domain-containing protein [Aliiglaciecola sp.]|uniref:AraC family transcriptional regulator n=1 Tax=Aliiglaciecola sp. TaxID=1872441 RepID=UPI00329A4708
MHLNLNLSDVEIVDFSELHVAILTHQGPPRALPSSIQNFIAWRKANKLSPNTSRTFNFMYDDPRVTDEAQYRLGLGVEVNTQEYSLPENMHFDTIPSGRCAYIRYIGAEHLLSDKVTYLFNHWLEATENIPAKFPLFFERVSFGEQLTEAEMITDIYLPLN